MTPCNFCRIIFKSGTVGRQCRYTRQSMNATNSVRPDAMQNDPVLAKISNCSRFLNSMLVSGSFADDASCH